MDLVVCQSSIDGCHGWLVHPCNGRRHKHWRTSRRWHPSGQFNINGARVHLGLVVRCPLASAAALVLFCAVALNVPTVRADVTRTLADTASDVLGRARQNRLPAQDLIPPGTNDVRIRAAETSPFDRAPFDKIDFKNSPDVEGDYPALPPDPYEEDKAELPPLDEHLWLHGGSYLYNEESDHATMATHEPAHHEYLRLPADWRAPEPVTMFADFLGADPIKLSHHAWYGPGEYRWEPRFVGYGSYELFAFALQQARRRQDVLGQQLLVDLDLRLTGTERFHAQFRPLGRRNTGGSFYQFASPAGYEDNSTGEPDRYWFEGEWHSLWGWCRDPLASKPIDFVLGKFPLSLHNTLLINDDILGGVVGQNNIQIGNLSNVNLQLFVGANDVDTYDQVESQVYGIHAAIDRRRAYYEATYAFVAVEADRDTHFAAFSRTKSYGRLSLAGRALFKWGDRGGSGNSQLLTLESNFVRVFEHPHLGFHQGIYSCNVFWAGEGWNSIAGGNFNRLRTAFEVDPLVRLAAGPAADDTVGVAISCQLFRNHEDEFLIPEVAWEQPAGDTVFGFGLRYQRKTGPRTFLELFGIVNWSENDQFDRDGIFLSHTILF